MRLRFSIQFMQYQARQLWLGLTRTVYAVPTVPILFAVAVAVALAYVPQIRELYLALIEDLLLDRAGASGSPMVHALFVLAAMTLLSGVIYFANASLSRTSVEQIFREHQSVVLDRRLAARVATIGCFAAGLPWIGLLHGSDAAVGNAIACIERIGFFAGAGANPAQEAARYFSEELNGGTVNTAAMSKLHGQLTSLRRNYLGYIPPDWRLLLFWLVATLWLRHALRVPGKIFWMVVGRPYVRPARLERLFALVGKVLGPLSDWGRRRLIALGSTLRGGTSYFATLLLLGSLLVPLFIETHALWPQDWSSLSGREALGALGTWWPGWGALHRWAGSTSTLTRNVEPIALWALASVAVMSAIFGYIRAERSLRRRLHRHWIVTTSMVLVRLVLAAGVLACIGSGFFEFGWMAIARGFGRLPMIAELGEAVAAIGRRWSGWAAWYNWASSTWKHLFIEGPIGLWAASAVAIALVQRGFTWGDTSLRRRYFRPTFIKVLMFLARAALLASFLACILSGFFEFEWVAIARAFGPLAMAIALCVVILKLIEVLGHVSRQTGLPFVAVIVAVGAVVVLNKLELGTWIVVVAVAFVGLGAVFYLAQSTITASVLACLAAISMVGAFKYAHTSSFWGWEPREPEGQRSQPSMPTPEITERFGAWYAAREAARRSYAQKNEGRPYPVFVIAAEGGGIYAAAASSAFLARIQERCPSFAQHVFAISGVSGGAVGAAIFHGAVDASQAGLTPEGCEWPMPKASDAEKPATLEGKIAAVIRQDHLSPLVGRFVPDVLGTFSDRAKGLQRSLETGMSENFSGGAAETPRSPWTEPFRDHWQINRPAPALVLNATWASVGNRVVFAPFNLETRDVVTLNDFASLGLRNRWEKDPAKVGLTEAAVVSARFPGVVAAYEMKNKDNRRWYFVDGGYVDASGALTAHDIYRSLVEKQIAAEAKRDGMGPAGPPGGVGKPRWHVDFRLVLLTSTQSNTKEQGTEGAQPRDLVAPVEALFNVRSLLSRNAVRETISKADRDTAEATINLNDHAQHGLPQRWKVTTIEINLDHFELALGWKISGLSHDIVALQMGQANLCDSANETARGKRRSAIGPLGNEATMARYATRSAGRAGKPDSALARYRASKAEKIRRAIEVAKTIRSNSCVLAAIEKLLNGGIVSPRPPRPHAALPHTPAHAAPAHAALGKIH